MAFSKVCMIKNCPEPAIARVDDGVKRLDLCEKDLRITALLYRDDIGKRIQVTYHEEKKDG